MTLWTPGGEHPVDRPSPEPEAEPPPEPSADEQAQLEAMQAEMDRVRAQLLEAPASVVIANHAMGIYELAAIHLTADAPKLGEVVLAIDALSRAGRRARGSAGRARTHPAGGAHPAEGRLPRRAQPGRRRRSRADVAMGDASGDLDG